jgi:predicted dehydrogenase
MSDKVRIGVVGTSWWADAMYLPALTAHPLADVRGVVGARPAHTREFADRWGVPGAYDTLDALLAAEPLDALVVLAPNRLHYGYAMAAIERGLHVLCEKPLAMTSAEARRLTDAAEAAGLVTMCPFTYRFMPVSRWLKELNRGLRAGARARAAAGRGRGRCP